MKIKDFARTTPVIMLLGGAVLAGGFCDGLVGALWAELNPARWSQHRTPDHNPAALRQPPLRGRMASRPRVRGRAFLGSTQGGGAVQFADLDGDGRAEALHNDSGTLRAYTLEGKRLWQTPYLNVSRVQVLDLDGDGRVELLATQFELGAERMLVLAPDTGAVLWRRTYPPGIRGYALEVGAFDPRKPGKQLFLMGSKDNLKRAWWYSFEPGLPIPQLDWCVGIPALLGATGGTNHVMYDVDHDGIVDPISINNHCIQVLDVDTGRDKWRVEWHSGGGPRRNYGRCYPTDLDGDGRTDFVQFGSAVEKHLSVLLNSPEGLKLGWTHWLGYYWSGGEEVQLEDPPGAVADLDGDGHLEVLARMYAVGEKKEWALHLYDGVTGQAKLILPTPQRVAGAADMNGDGVLDLFLEDDSGARVITLKGGQPLELWGEEGAEFVSGDRGVWVADVDGREGIEFFITARGQQRLLQWQGDSCREIWGAVEVKPLMEGAAPRRGDYDGDGVAEFLADVGGSLIGYQWQRNGFVRHWPPDGQDVPLNAQVQDLTGDGRVDVVLTTGSAYSLRTWEGDEIAFSPPSVWSPALPVLRDREGDGQEEMYAVRSDGQTVRLSLPPSEEETEGIPELSLEPAKIPPAPASAPPYDFDGDGQVDTLSISPTLIVATRSDGTELWRREVPADPLNPRNVVVGHLLGRKGHDVYLAWFLPGSNGRQGPGVCLHGETGEEVWRVDRISPAFGGPDWFAPPANTCQVWDLDGDGCDEVLLGINTTYVALSGRDGSYVAGPSSLGGYWGGVFLQDVDADDVPELVLTTLHAAMGVLNLDGSPIWRQSIPVGAVIHPYCTGDVDGDGKLETGRVFNDGILRCLNLWDGQERWTLPLPARKPDWFVAADVDGDGGDEFLLLCDRVIYCYQETPAGRGELLWECDQAEQGFHQADLQDVDHDGWMELIATSYDGGIWILDTP